jgi:hypothetical protein
MKNTPRIRRNAAIKAASLQPEFRARKPAKSNPLAEPEIDGAFYSGNEPVCLTMFDHEKDAYLAGCDIKPSEVKIIQGKARQAGVPVSRLLRRAVDFLLADIPTTELEMAVTEANALSRLLADNMECQVRSGCDFGGTKDELFSSGVSQLVNDSNENLRRAFDETFHAIFGKAEIPAMPAHSHGHSERASTATAQRELTTEEIGRLT